MTTTDATRMGATVFLLWRPPNILERSCRFLQPVSAVGAQQEILSSAVGVDTAVICRLFADGREIRTFQEVSPVGFRLHPRVQRDICTHVNTAAGAVTGALTDAEMIDTYPMLSLALFS